MRSIRRATLALGWRTQFFPSLANAAPIGDTPLFRFWGRWPGERWLGWLCDCCKSDSKRTPMSATRAVILAAAQNKWLKERASRYHFVRKSVSRFMPGESLADAVAAAHQLHTRGLGTVFTHLGENVADAGEAESVVAHYLKVLERIRAENLPTEISVKPTQLGLDLSPSLCAQNLRRLLAAESPQRTLWIDMESSPYVDRTLELYRDV